MEKKQVLIEVLSSFKDTGIKAAQIAVRDMARQLKQTAVTIPTQVQAATRSAGAGFDRKMDRLQTRLDAAVTRELKAQIADRRRLITLTNKLDRELKKEGQTAGFLANALSRLNSALRAVGGGSSRAAGGIVGLFRQLQHMRSEVGRSITSLVTFQNIIGRITTGFLVVQFWRALTQGVQDFTNAIIESNSNMQTAVGTFTALSGGSSEMANIFIKTLQQMSIEGGVAFDKLLEGARRLPSKIGQNVAAFEELTKIAIVLSRIDPIQGIEGAFFALTNALEGGAQGLRSLIQRFEIGTVAEFNEALAETGDAVSALTRMLEENGIQADAFLKATENAFPIALAGVNASLREFLRLATEPIFTKLTGYLVDLRDWFKENQAAVQGLAKALGDQLLGVFDLLVNFIKEVVLGGQELTAANIFDAIIQGAIALIDWLSRAIEQVIMFVTAVVEAFADGLNFIFELFGGSELDGGKTSRAIQSVGAAAEQAGGGLNTLKEGVGAVGQALQNTLPAAAQASEEAVRRTANAIVEALSQIDPSQGASKIREVLNNALGGGEEAIRAFLQRFEIGTMEEFKRALAETGNEVLAFAKMMADNGIDVESFLGGLPQAMETVANVVKVSTKSIVSSLISMKNIGKETLKQMVEGMVQGLSGSQIQEVIDGVLNNIINLEAQEIAQEQWIENLEEWVDEAEKEVNKARNKLRLFDLATEDIPERFTRARRRQLELEILRAENERDRRKEALDAAKKQLEVTKKNLEVQRQILSALEAAQKVADEAEGGAGINKGFVPGSVNFEEFDKNVEAARQRFNDRLEPVFDRLKQALGEVGAFVRGLFGAEGGSGFDKMREAGERMAAAFSTIKERLGGVIEIIKGWFSTMLDSYNGLPPALQTLLLILLGLELLPGGQIPINFIAGIAYSTGAHILPWLLGLLVGNPLGAVLTLATLSLVILATTNREELLKWLSGERIKELVIDVTVIGVELLNKLLVLFGMEDLQIKVPGINLDQAEGAGTNFGKLFVDELEQSIADNPVAASILESVFLPGFTVLRGILSLATGEAMGDVSKTVEGQASAMETATQAGVKNPILAVFNDIWDALTRNSIVPEMMNDIIRLFTTLPTRLVSPLRQLFLMVMNQMRALRIGWTAEWNAMVNIAQRAMQQTANLQESTLRNIANIGQRATQSNLANFGNRSQGLSNVSLKLDAKETRRLMEEGVYNGIINTLQGA